MVEMIRSFATPETDKTVAEYESFCGTLAAFGFNFDYSYMQYYITIVLISDLLSLIISVFLIRPWYISLMHYVVIFRPSTSFTDLLSNNISCNSIMHISGPSYILQKKPFIMSCGLGRMGSIKIQNCINCSFFNLKLWEILQKNTEYYSYAILRLAYNKLYRFWQRILKKIFFAKRSLEE